MLRERETVAKGVVAATSALALAEKQGVSMPIDPNAIGAKTEPSTFSWIDRDTLLYALGVGAGTQDLASRIYVAVGDCGAR